MRSTETSLLRAASTFAVCSMLLGALAARPASAQATKKPAAAAEMPRTATARWTDTTWSTSATQQGACSKHGGVAKWFGKAPKDATARCKDGEYWTSPERQGACTGHDGVAFWLGKKSK